LRSEQAQTIALLLHELATNAAKYGALSVPEGKIEIQWSVEDSSLRLDWIETLPDATATGDGIVKAGFGSRLINSVIERQLGGSITRRFDHGLKCRIAIPLSIELPERAARAAGRKVPNAQTGRVLIVEDEALVALDLANMLRVLGYNSVETVSSVQEALSVLRKDARPSLAIVDVNLAGESSEPVVEKLRSLGTQTILASGYAHADSLPGAFSGLTCLSKPIILSDFTKEIQRIGGEA
jgi:CheY-like chemotaxis protein